MSRTVREVVVTGGTGALGRALVQTFLAQGDRVLVPWIVKQERDAVGKRFGTAIEAGHLVLFEADLVEAAGSAELERRSAAADVLVNGVGGFEGGSAVAETDVEVWDRMYRVNLRTAVAATRAVLPGMFERRRGVVVYVASRAAFEQPPGLAAYSATKAALVVLAQTLHQEVAPHGIRVNAVVPTTIDTPANRAAMPDADFSTWTPPERIAAVVRWLASDEAGVVRGGFIPV